MPIHSLSTVPLSTQDRSKGEKTMSTPDLLLITSIIIGMATVRFGLPMLVMWTVRRIGQRTLYRQV